MAALVPAGVGAPAYGASKARHCKVDHLAAIDKRLHVKCAAGQEAYTNDITYYAMSLTEPVVKTKAIVAMVMESKKQNRPVRIWFDDSDYASVPECRGADCRKMLRLALE